MNNVANSNQADSGFQFMGRINASLSHDINNVFATINELVGLLDDMLVAQQRGRELDPERVQRTSTRIGAQIVRGQELIKQLNRFAHSVDHAQADLDLRAVVNDIVTLSQRFARLRRVELQFSPGSEPVVVVGNAFALQQCIFAALEIALECTAERSALQVSVDRGTTGINITVHVPGAAALEAEQLHKLAVWQQLGQQLGLSCLHHPDADTGSRFVLSFPAGA